MSSDTSATAAPSFPRHNLKEQTRRKEVQVASNLLDNRQSTPTLPFRYLEGTAEPVPRKRSEPGIFVGLASSNVAATFAPNSFSSSVSCVINSGGGGGKKVCGLKGTSEKHSLHCYTTFSSKEIPYSDNLHRATSAKQRSLGKAKGKSFVNASIQLCWLYEQQGNISASQEERLVPRKLVFQFAWRSRRDSSNTLQKEHP